MPKNYDYFIVLGLLSGVPGTFSQWLILMGVISGQPHIRYSCYIQKSLCESTFQLGPLSIVIDVIVIQVTE